MGSGDLSYAQLKGTWLKAAKGTQYDTNGWASLMAAIAEAESGGNPTATNPTDNNGAQTSWGLWQISLGNHAQPASNWADPVENARLAIGKLEGQGLGAWGTYNSGAYRPFLSGKTSADLNIPAGPNAVTTAALTSANKASAECAWAIGWGGIPDTSWLIRLFSFGQAGGNIGRGELCIFSKSQARALIGTGLVLAGGIIMGGGLILVAASAGLKYAGPVAAAIPGAKPVAAAAAVAETQPRSQGTLADRRGTSSEFREQFGLSA